MWTEERRALAALESARPAIVRAAEAFGETLCSGRRCFLLSAETSCWRRSASSAERAVITGRFFWAEKRLRAGL